MARINRLITSLLERLDKAELNPEATPSETAAFEARHLRTALGPILYRLLAKKLGLNSICTRKDMDQVASLLLRMGV
jgi:hypothetical protein